MLLMRARCQPGYEYGKGQVVEEQGVDRPGGESNWVPAPITGRMKWCKRKKENFTLSNTRDRIKKNLSKSQFLYLQ